MCAPGKRMAWHGTPRCCRCCSRRAHCVLFPHRSTPSSRMNAPRGRSADAGGAPAVAAALILHRTANKGGARQMERKAVQPSMAAVRMRQAAVRGEPYAIAYLLDGGGEMWQNA